jgi:hypothetical protein
MITHLGLGFPKLSMQRTSRSKPQSQAHYIYLISDGLVQSPPGSGFLGTAVQHHLVLSTSSQSSYSLGPARVCTHNDPDNTDPRMTRLQCRLGREAGGASSFNLKLPLEPQRVPAACLKLPVPGPRARAQAGPHSNLKAPGGPSRPATGTH